MDLELLNFIRCVEGMYGGSGEARLEKHCFFFFGEIAKSARR